MFRKNESKQGIGFEEGKQLELIIFAVNRLKKGKLSTANQKFGLMLYPQKTYDGQLLVQKDNPNRIQHQQKEKNKSLSNFSKQSVLCPIILVIMLGATFILCIRSEVNQSQAQQTISEINIKLLTLENWKNEFAVNQISNLNNQSLSHEYLKIESAKQCQKIQQQEQEIQYIKNQLLGYEQMKTESVKQGFQTQQLEEDIQSIKNQLLGYEQLKIESAKQFLQIQQQEQEIQSIKNQLLGYDQLKTESVKQGLQTQQLEEEIRNMKNQLLGYEQFKSSFANLKEQHESQQNLFYKLLSSSSEEDIKQVKISLSSLISEFQEQKISLAVSKVEIQHLQSNIITFNPQISSLASLNVEITNIKEKFIDLKASLNDHIKQTNPGSTTSPTQTTTTTTDPTSTPTPTSTDSINIFGPFVSSNTFQLFLINSDKFSTFDTTNPCILDLKRRAVVTLIANGLGITGPGHAQMTFMHNGKQNLPLTDHFNYRFGACNLHYLSSFVPISLTQEFIVETGIHEFTFGVGKIAYDGNSQQIEIRGLSFIAKVTYF